MWIFFAFGASVLWGISYVLSEPVYKKISVTTYFALVCLVMFIVMAVASLLSGKLKTDLGTVVSSRRLLWLVVGGTATSIVADLFIGLSIQAKNATLSGLIEISYPIFVAIFAYLFFRENELSAATVVGGCLIFAGVFVIYFFNR